MLDHVINLLREVYRYFFVYMEYVSKARDMIISHPQFTEVTQKVSKYLDMNNIKLIITEYEESLKSYNRLTMLFTILIYFYILRFVCHLICDTWNRISNNINRLINLLVKLTLKLN